MAVSPREKIMLISTGKDKNGKDTKYFYTTLKNKRNTTEKLKIKKFDPWAWNEKTGTYGLHVEFIEKKIPK